LEENVAHGGDKFIAFTGSILNIHFCFQSSQRFPSFSAPTQLWLSAGLRLSHFHLFQLARPKASRVGNYLLTFLPDLPKPPLILRSLSCSSRWS